MDVEKGSNGKLQMASLLENKENVDDDVFEKQFESDMEENSDLKEGKPLQMPRPKLQRPLQRAKRTPGGSTASDKWRATVRQKLIKPLRNMTPIANRIERSAFTRVICGLYCMIACVFGIVFPISDAITAEEGVHGYYTEVFHLYMFTCSLAALVYIFIFLFKNPKKKNQNGIELRSKLRTNTRISSNGPESPENNEAPPSYGKIDDSPLHKQSSVDQCSHYEGEGINFYLRLGAVGFGLGTMLLAGFRISEPFENEATVQCRSYLFQPNAVMLVLFVFVQTFFMFKHHKIVFNRNKPLIRLCMMHLLATNLSLWLSATTHETAEDIGRAPTKGKEESISSGETFTHENTTEIPHIDCHDKHTLSDHSSPYLYPCMIEYSLIAAAICFRFYTSVGKRVDPDEELEDSDDMENSHQDECQRSTKGLFLGLFVVFLTLISVALFFVFESIPQKRETAGIIFLSSEIFLTVILSIATIMGIIYFRKLKFSGKSRESIDDKLLMIALVGQFMMHTFHAVASANTLARGYKTQTSAMYFVWSIAEFVQTTLQSFFILDGYSRCSPTRAIANRKPGRSVISFLLVVNLAMWITATFEAKKGDIVDIHVQVYQYLPYSIIMHLCLPLVIFFRFHSSVCLSDIWHHAYTYEKKRN